MSEYSWIPFVLKLADEFGLTDHEMLFLQDARIQGAKQLADVLNLSPNLAAFVQTNNKNIDVSKLRAIATGTQVPVNIGQAGKPPAGLMPKTAKSYRIHNEKPMHLGTPPPISGRWPARDQGSRNTCVAFAVASCLEALGDSNGQIPQFSAEFLYNRMLGLGQRDAPTVAWQDGATRLVDAKEILLQDGICGEAYWPYGQPESTILEIRDIITKNAETQKRSECEICYRKLTNPTERSGMALQLLQFVRNKIPIAVALPWFNGSGLSNDGSNWKTFDSETCGIVQMPIDGVWKELDVGHVICIIGFEPYPFDDAGGLFLFKNSYGNRFASQPGSLLVGQDLIRAPDVGYGYIPATYIERYVWEILAISAKGQPIAVSKNVAATDQVFS